MHRSPEPISKDEERGFTLIEVLIVIIVLGILAAIVVLAVGRTRNDAAAAACKTAVGAVQLSAQTYHTRVGHYPDTQADVHGPHGLLREWPVSDYYSLVYAPTGYSAGPPVIHATGFTVTVQDAAGLAVGGCSDL